MRESAKWHNSSTHAFALQENPLLKDTMLSRSNFSKLIVALINTFDYFIAKFASHWYVLFLKKTYNNKPAPNITIK